MKFKAGDKFTVGFGHSCGQFNTGDVVTVKEVYLNGAITAFNDSGSCWDRPSHFDPRDIKQGATMSRRTFRLLKETDLLKKGTIFQEQCDDGDQPYEVISQDSYKFERAAHQTVRSRGAIENNPKWFEEVFPASEVWLTKDELKSFKDWQKRQGKKR